MAILWYKAGKLHSKNEFLQFFVGSAVTNRIARRFFQSAAFLAQSLQPSEIDARTTDAFAATRVEPAIRRSAHALKR